MATRGRLPVPPASFHTAFYPSDVQPWDPFRFEVVRKLQNADRNKGVVYLVHDKKEERFAAMKQMPNDWILGNHDEFMEKHPQENEQPWKDIGAIRFLSSLGFPFLCELIGVFRDDRSTGVVTSFASGGDLFGWCDQLDMPPSPAREVAVWPVMVQLTHAVRLLHEMSIVHRDLSMENVLLSQHEGEGPPLQTKLIDFAMCSTSRWGIFSRGAPGKPTYQAPEIHRSEEYDGFLADAFSIGVILYSVLLKDYPWMSTRPGGCKCFEYCQKHGFRSYIKKRKLRGTSTKVHDVMSEPLINLLEGLLQIDPSRRLTVGEAGAWGTRQRKSAWEEPWMRSGPGGSNLGDQHPATGNAPPSFVREEETVHKPEGLHKDSAQSPQAVRAPEKHDSFPLGTKELQDFALARSMPAGLGGGRLIEAAYAVQASRVEAPATNFNY